MNTISSSNALEIGYSGLYAAQKQIEVTSNNIANANTQGFARSDLHYAERNVRAGVDVSAYSTYDTNLNAAQNLDTQQVAKDTAMQTAFNDLSNKASNSGIAQAWDNFTAQVIDFRQKGDPNGNKRLIDQAGHTLSDAISKWQTTVQQSKQSIQDNMALDQKDLDSLKGQLQVTSDPTIKAQIQSQIATIQGRMEGNNAVLVTIFPELDKQTDAAMSAAANQVNTELGKNVLQYTGTLPNGQRVGKMTYDSNALTGKDVVNSSITTDTISRALGTILTQIGYWNKENQTKLDAANASLQASSKAVQDASGVDLVRESVDLVRAQNMYQAMAKVMDIDNQNFKTLLGIA